MELHQLGTSHAFAAEYCLRALTLSLDTIPETFSDHESWVRPKDITDSPMIDEYVCTYWPHHLKRSGKLRHVEPLYTLFSTFAMEQRAVSPYFSQWNKKRSLLLGTSPETCRYPTKDFEISFPADVLFVACVWEFEELLQRRVDADSGSLDVRNIFGMTGLHITCRLGTVEAARMLIEKGVDLEATVWNRTAVKLAVFYRHTALMQLLVDSGASLDATLYSLIKQGSTTMARILLDLGANPHALISDEACCMLHLAVELGQELVVERMLETTHAGEIERKEWLARAHMMAVVKKANEAEVTALFRQENFSTLIDQETLQAALWLSERQNNVKVARIMIDAGADVNLRRQGTSCWWIGKHTLWLGTRSGYGKLLLEHVIGRSTRTKFAELLLDSGAFSDAPSPSNQPLPLETAVRDGNQVHVMILIDRGARIDGTNYVLATGPADVYLGSLLDMAESRGHGAIARLLSERGVPSAVRRLTKEEFEASGTRKEIEYSNEGFEASGTRKEIEYSNEESFKEFCPTKPSWLHLPRFVRGRHRGSVCPNTACLESYP